MRKLCSVSVDLDEIPNYFQIHGLQVPAGDTTATLVYDVAVGRLCTLASDAGLPLTLFTIGSDMARPEAAAQLRAARSAGHEIANHSLDHRYDLVKLGRGEIARQITEGADAIERAVGERAGGVGAPRDTISDEGVSRREGRGGADDTSVFPCPAYFGAKAAAIGLIAARGRKSHSVLDTPRVLTAPTVPYRVGTPYWKRGQGIREIPVQVTRGLRLPFIGTSVTLAGPDRARWLAKMCVGDELVNLELHGIDVLDAADGLEALRPFQPDVRVTKEKKLAALHAAIDVLKGAGYTFVTMREAASAILPG
jgi:peptidoglycan/xylan/chitin deacetylase (PgdA/CDA1 family)